VDSHRTSASQSGIKRPSGESGQYGREKRTHTRTLTPFYTLTGAILASSAAPGHGARITEYPVPELQDAHARANADMSTANNRAGFEKLFLPHLDPLTIWLAFLPAMRTMRKMWFRNLI
jgi:hypothetical protein